MKSQRFTLEDLQRKGFSVAGNQATKISKENKIRGAQKSTIDGIRFASKLELYLYNLLKAARITFLFQERFILQPGFTYQGKKIHPITIIVDFYLPQFNLIIDTKGFQLADNKIKFKMLKYSLYNSLSEYRIELPAKKDDCDRLVNELLKQKS